MPLSADETRALAMELTPLIAQSSAPPLLDADQAGVLLGVKASWLLTEARADRVPHVRLGKYVRFNRDALLAWVEGRMRGPKRGGRPAHTGPGPVPLRRDAA